MIQAMKQASNISQPQHQLNARIPADLNKRLDLAAVHMNTTKQALAISALEAFLSRKEIERQLTEEETHG